VIISLKKVKKSPAATTVTVTLGRWVTLTQKMLCDRDTRDSGPGDIDQQPSTVPINFEIHKETSVGFM